MPPKKGKETVLGWKEIIVVLKNDNVTFLILKIPNFNHCSDVCIYIYIYSFLHEREQNRQQVYKTFLDIEQLQHHVTDCKGK